MRNQLCLPIGAVLAGVLLGLLALDGGSEGAVLPATVSCPAQSGSACEDQATMPDALAADCQSIPAGCRLGIEAASVSTDAEAAAPVVPEIDLVPGVYPEGTSTLVRPVFRVADE